MTGWHFPIFVGVSLLVFIGVLVVVLRGRTEGRPSTRAILSVAAIVVVGGMVFARFGTSLGLPVWIYYGVPAVLTWVLPPLAFRMRGREIAAYLVLAVLMAPAIHVAFWFFLGWDEYMPFLALPARGGTEEIVEMVGAGHVSTELPEFASAVSASGDTLFFNRTPPDRSRLDLFYSVKSDGAWQTARPFEPTEGTTAIDPFVSPDGRRLYFSSSRPHPTAAAGSFNLWYLERTGVSWGLPEALPAPIASDSSDIFNSLARDGMMVFSSTRNGTRRIYETSPSGSGWTEPVPLIFGETIDGSNPVISVDGDFIVYARSEPNQAADLFLSCRTASGWGAPQRLPSPLNSDFAEFAPGLSSDHLYFTSERPGIVGIQPDSVRPPGDIYRTPITTVRRLCASR